MGIGWFYLGIDAWDVVCVRLIGLRAFRKWGWGSRAQLRTFTVTYSIQKALKLITSRHLHKVGCGKQRPDRVGTECLSKGHLGKLIGGKSNPRSRLQIIATY
jgi:hypothetical protein